MYEFFFLIFNYIIDIKANDKSFYIHVALLKLLHKTVHLLLMSVSSLYIHQHKMIMGDLTLTLVILTES